MTVYVIDGTGTYHARTNCAIMSRDGRPSNVHQFRPCAKCATDLTTSQRIYRKEQDIGDADFERFRSKGKGEYDHPEPLVEVGKEKLKFNESAIEAGGLDGYNYVNYLISSDDKMVGIKPVSGGEVDGASYRLQSRGYVRFKKIRDSLDVDLGRGKTKLEVEWDTDREMFVVDFSGVKA